MKKIIGVGLLLFTSIEGVPKMYTVKELKAKPSIFKEVGMIGPPFETMEEKDDDNIETTITRLIQEETPFSISEICLHEIISEDFNLIPKRPDIFTRYAYASLKSDPPEEILELPDIDISFAGWHPLCEMYDKFTRIETLPILNHFKRNSHYAKLCHLVLS
ncbi:MAG TPA: hypothetical protein DEA43_02420 [Candidatus Moranbacteria bacterium]|nr:hypothetical protein [Candidatus Moranbacteria bacterium]HBT45720.1 hypothetical protein [Candidatus Moranbacteria bacterium]